jgi:hypothetical protein
MSNLSKTVQHRNLPSKNPVTIKLCIGIGCMSNQRKAEFVNGNFGIQSFCGGHGKILPKSRFVPEGQFSNPAIVR